MYLIKFTFLVSFLSWPAYVVEKYPVIEEPPTKITIPVKLPAQGEDITTIQVPVGKCEEMDFGPDANKFIQDRWLSLTETIAAKGFTVPQLKKAIEAVVNEESKKGSVKDKGKLWFLRRAEPAFWLVSTDKDVKIELEMFRRKFIKSLIKLDKAFESKFPIGDEPFTVEQLKEIQETIINKQQEKIAELEKTDPFGAMALKREFADVLRTAKNAISLLSDDEDSKKERNAALSELMKALEKNQVIETKCHVWQALTQ